MRRSNFDCNAGLALYGMTSRASVPQYGAPEGRRETEAVHGKRQAEEASHDDGFATDVV